MNNSPFFHLGISMIKALKYDFEWPILKSKYNRGLWYYNDVTSMLDSEWLLRTKQMGLEFNSALIFYKPAEYIIENAHIDVIKRDPPEKVVCAFNWTIGGNGSEMIWYNDPTNTLEITWLPGGIPVANYSLSELHEINRTRISNCLTMVRTDIPHAIQCSNDPRWCISLRPKHGFYSTWESATHAMEYII
jgi:hypothetical protein